MTVKRIPHSCARCGLVEQRDQLRDLAVGVALLAVAQTLAWLV